MSKLGLILIVSVVFSVGCASDPGGPVFGDEGTPSSSAQELLAKADPLTNDHIAGVYERTGMSSGIYPGPNDTTFRVYNNWVYRIELRATMLTTVLQCNLTYTESGRAPKTLLPFVQQNAEATDEFYRITAPGKKTETDTLSMSECSIDQPATAWAYCEETGHGSGYYTNLPDGANLCIGRAGQNLQLVDLPYDAGEFMGKKVAN
jgi:hypothetical protein